jgi:pentatricopeptide repeat protein
LKLISVILPFYNAKDTIAEAIESLFFQTYSNWELLLINDGSNDASKAICQSFSDKRIRYFEQKNKGVSSARNVGLSHMEGDYFCFLDADDVLPLNSLQARYNVFQKQRELDFVDGKVNRMDEQLKDVLSSWVPNFQGNPFQDLITLRGKSFFGPSWMVKREVNKKYHMREGLAHAEDLLFCMELTRKGGQYGHTEETVLHYRNSPGSAMKNLPGLEKGYRQVYEEIKGWPEIEPNDLVLYRQRSKQIIIRSYLRNGDFSKALKVWKSWS